MERSNSSRLQKSSPDYEADVVRLWGVSHCPCDEAAYDLQRILGKGASATVYHGTCIPLHQQVAVKKIDLEDSKNSLEHLEREAQVMRDMCHPCLLPLLSSFVSGQYLWMVMPYAAGGSLLDILVNHHPDGFDEPVIATIMREVLRGLDYMHRRGRIHRDIKAANILVSETGNVVLADFGVTTTGRPDGDEPPPTPKTPVRHDVWSCQKYLARNTFCGTPSFMAPEVVEQKLGYDYKADIWSFGITMIELATGKAPYANMSLSNVVLATINESAPKLDCKVGSRRFSEAMQDLVAKCLCKDANDRPTAAELLKHRFFKHAHDCSYIAKKLLGGLCSSSGSPHKAEWVRSLSRTFLHSKKSFKAAPEKENAQVVPRLFHGYSVATLSGDVVNALSLLKTLTRSRKRHPGLLPEAAVQRCKGIAFGIIREASAGMGRGHGFVLAKRADQHSPLRPSTPVAGESARALRKTVSSPALRKSKSQLGLGDKVAKAASKVQGASWTAPSYFDILVGGLGCRSWHHKEVECAILLNTDEALESFKAADSVLGLEYRGPGKENSGDDEDAPVLAYCLIDHGDRKEMLEVDLTGARVHVNTDANGRMFGPDVDTDALLGGETSSPPEFDPLYRQLTALASPKGDVAAQALQNIDKEGSTLLYRMPHWMYD